MLYIVFFVVSFLCFLPLPIFCLWICHLLTIYYSLWYPVVVWLLIEVWFGVSLVGSIEMMSVKPFSLPFSQQGSCLTLVSTFFLSLSCRMFRRDGVCFCFGGCIRPSWPQSPHSPDNHTIIGLTFRAWGTLVVRTLILPMLSNKRVLSPSLLRSCIFLFEHHFTSSHRGLPTPDTLEWY